LNHGDGDGVLRAGVHGVGTLVDKYGNGARVHGAGTLVHGDGVNETGNLDKKNGVHHGVGALINRDGVSGGDSGVGGIFLVDAVERSLFRVNDFI